MAQLKDLQLEYTSMYWGALGRRRRRKKIKITKRRLATDVPIFKKKNHKVEEASHVQDVRRSFLVKC